MFQFREALSSVCAPLELSPDPRTPAAISPAHHSPPPRPSSSPATLGPSPRPAQFELLLFFFVLRLALQHSDLLCLPVFCTRFVRSHDREFLDGPWTNFGVHKVVWSWTGCDFRCFFLLCLRLYVRLSSSNFLCILSYEDIGGAGGRFYSWMIQFRSLVIWIFVM